MRLISIALLIVSLVSGSVKGQPTPVSLEQIDSALRQEAWAIPVWENVDSSLVIRIKQRLHHHPVSTTSNSHALVYFAYFIERLTRVPASEARSTLDTLLYGYNHFYTLLKSQTKPIEGMYEGVYLNSIGTHYLRLSVQDSAYIFFSESDKAFASYHPKLSRPENATDSSRIGDFYSAWGAPVGNLHTSLLNTVHLLPGKREINQSYNKILRYLIRADSLFELGASFNPYDKSLQKDCAIGKLNLANAYFQLLNDSSSAFAKCREAWDIVESHHLFQLTPQFANVLAGGYLRVGNKNLSKYVARSGLQAADTLTKDVASYSSLFELRYRLSDIYLQERNYDSAMYFIESLLSDSSHYINHYQVILLLTGFCEQSIYLDRTKEAKRFYALLKHFIKQDLTPKQGAAILLFDEQRNRELLLSRYDALSEAFDSGTDGFNYLYLATFMTALLSAAAFAIYHYFKP